MINGKKNSEKNGTDKHEQKVLNLTVHFRTRLRLQNVHYPIAFLHLSLFLICSLIFLRDANAYFNEQYFA